MHVARFDDETITLTEETYVHIPHWRLMSSRGRLHCVVCGEAVEVVAGISRKPLFRHKRETTCSPLMDAEVLLASERGSEVARAAEGDTGAKAVAVRSAPLATSATAAASTEKRFRFRLTPKHRIQVVPEQETDRFHPEQERAVMNTDGALLILAGAGSGKTRVMTARAAHLIQAKGIDPRSIMVVTFTTKAAEEMKHRLRRRLTPEQAQSLIAGTFHSLFYKMLLHSQPDRYDQRNLLKFDWQKKKFLRESGLLAEMHTPISKETELDTALGVISRWKNEYILPADAGKLHVATPEERQAQELYPLYEQMKQQKMWFDFDDMLIGCYELLQSNERVRGLYQNRIRYLMIDEFQDINRVQYETVKLLAAPHNNLCVIGDDDQSIYGFRGSDPKYILGFTRDYPTAETITLEVNYRSRPSIVGLGYSLIGNNRTRWKKDFKSFHPEEGDCYLFQPLDEEEQASRIVDEIKTGLAEGLTPRQFAILFRTYESTRPIVERLTEAGIPVAFTREDEPFYQKQTVRFALGYLRLALNRDDDQALRDVLPTLYLSPSHWNELRSQAILRDVPLVDVLPRLPHLKVFQRTHLEKVGAVLRQLSHCTPGQALEMVYEDLKLRDYVKKRAKDRSDTDNDRATDDLRQLLVAAKRHTSIREFLTYIEQMLTKEAEYRNSRQAPSDAVQLLSIHRAKGLEFDTVFLVDVVEGALPHEYAIEQKRQGTDDALEEERRLMYVAITRARHHLFIGVPQERFGRKTRMSRFIAEMGRGVRS